MSSIETWLWLLMVMRPFNPRTHMILEKYGYDAALAAKAMLGGRVGLCENEKLRAEALRNQQINDITRLCEENDISIITLDSEDYPPLLREAPNPPIVLFCAGDIKVAHEELIISAVGTRKGSDYGCRTARRLITQLSKCGAAIVSGLAVGLDTVSHCACLDSGGRTAGVLACGIMVNYPAQNSELKRRIVEQGGAIISELLPYDRPSAEYFQYRNRMIAGISRATLVLEAGINSGTLLTAGHAAEMGRDVFFIPPHDIFSPQFAGQTALGRDGAIPVYGAEDVLCRLLGLSQLDEMLGKISE